MNSPSFNCTIAFLDDGFLPLTTPVLVNFDTDLPKTFIVLTLTTLTS